jgi:oligoribonuclease NrnB/cAMP/cGMP phosphodiesterase (DHH superfamily)
MLLQTEQEKIKLCLTDISAFILELLRDENQTIKTVLEILRILGNLSRIPNITEYLHSVNIQGIFLFLLEHHSSNSIRSAISGVLINLTGNEPGRVTLLSSNGYYESLMELFTVLLKKSALRDPRIALMVVQVSFSSVTKSSSLSLTLFYFYFYLKSFSNILTSYEFKVLKTSVLSRELINTLEELLDIFQERFEETQKHRGKADYKVENERKKGFNDSDSEESTDNKDLHQFITIANSVLQSISDIPYVKYI